MTKERKHKHTCDCFHNCYCTEKKREIYVNVEMVLILKRSRDKSYKDPMGS